MHSRALQLYIHNEVSNACDMFKVENQRWIIGFKLENMTYIECMKWRKKTRDEFQALNEMAWHKLNV